MTRTEAIDILKNTIVRFGRINGKTAYAEALQMAIKALAEPHWILCSEELPEKNGVYLVCYEDVTVPLDWFNGKWFFYKSNPAVEETGTIIAWMQMPEPWKEGDVE